MIKKSVLVCLFLIPTFALAADDGYLCKVTTELYLNDDGSLRTVPLPLAIGKQFAVDRKTGKMINSDIFFWKVETASVSVKDHGNSVSSFIATYTNTTGGTFFTTLNVEEYADTERKPFILTAGAGVYAGVCE
jgi:hypothetical protein